MQKEQEVSHSAVKLEVRHLWLKQPTGKQIKKRKWMQMRPYQRPVSLIQEVLASCVIA